MSRFALVVLALGVGCCLDCGAVGADATGLAQHDFRSATVSPDGRHIADLEADEPVDETVRPVRRLVVRDVGGGAPVTVPLPCGEGPNCTPSDPAWSPDGRRLVFVLADAGKPERRLEVVDPGTTAPRTLLSFRGTLAEPRFAGDGRIAVLAIADAHKDLGATAAAVSLAGEIGTSEDEQRIAIVDGGALRFVTPAGLFVYQYDWLPDGRGFVATAAPGNGDQNWYVSRLMAFDVAGITPRVLFAPHSYQQQIADPVVSPDGKRVAFIVGVMSDFGSTGGDVWSVRTDGGQEARDLTEGSDASFASLNWGCGGELLASAIEGPRTEIARIEGRSGHRIVAWSEEATLGLGGWDPAISCGGGTAAAILERVDSPPALVAGPVGTLSLHAVSHDNDGLRPRWGGRVVRWSEDGFDETGWLLEPAGAPRRGKRPMITVVHGGPSAAYTATWPRRGFERDLLAAGYDLFLPNPRGSYGHGEAFASADVRDLGPGPLRDILAGVDAVGRMVRLDSRRLGLFGYSYGGYMAMWAPTATDRFRASVAGAGISDWISLDGETGVEKADLALFGAPAFDALPLYLSQSPVAHVRSVHTPVFVFAGDHDEECPVQQSLEYWHGLREVGVPTEFMVYAGQGHGMADPKDRADASRRTIAWFGRWLHG